VTLKGFTIPLLLFVISIFRLTPQFSSVIWAVIIEALGVDFQYYILRRFTSLYIVVFLPDFFKGKMLVLLGPRQRDILFVFFAERGVRGETGHDDHQEWNWLGSGTYIFHTHTHTHTHAHTHSHTHTRIHFWHKLVSTILHTDNLNFYSHFLCLTIPQFFPKITTETTERFTDLGKLNFSMVVWF